MTASSDVDPERIDDEIDRTVEQLVRTTAGESGGCTVQELLAAMGLTELGDRRLDQPSWPDHRRRSCDGVVRPGAWPTITAADADRAEWSTGVDE